MLKKVRALIIFILVFAAVCGFTVNAAQSTTYTYTISVENEWIRTQDAYLSGTDYCREIGLSQPNDLFYYKDSLYITDTGNGRIAVLELNTQKATFFGQGELMSPMGIFVSGDGTVYVADSKKEAVVIFNSDKTVKQVIGRPDSYLFSDRTLFNPVNVVVSSQGNIFVVGQGTSEGIMQFDRSGEFQGFFANNKYKMSFMERIEDLILTEEQLSAMLSRTPRPIANIDITDDDLIFSVTQSEDMDRYNVGSQTENHLKLHNMAGVNIYSQNSLLKEEWNFTDVAAAKNGNVYALTKTGLIDEYDENGNLIFSFGGRAAANDRNGMFTGASAVDVGDNGYLYILDKERGLIQTMFPTDFADFTHQAINELNKGNYTSSEQTWKDLLQFNSMSRFAHIGYGKTLLYQQRYSEAMEHFKLANDKANYSEAFWQLRNNWINNNMLYIILILILSVACYTVYGCIRRKRGTAPKEKGTRAPQNGLINQIMYSSRMLKAPFDSYYEIKLERRASVISATILYFIAFIVYLFDTFARAYIFKMVDIEKTNPWTLIFIFWVPLALWLVGNYFVSTINEGEGSFRRVYVSMAYAFAPYIWITPFIVALSYLLTQNEAFIITLGWTVSLIWTGVLIFIQVMEIHQYSFKQAVKNVLLTLIFMILAVITISIIYLLGSQVVNFAKTILSEVAYHATN